MPATLVIEGMDEALKNFRALEGAFADEKVEQMLLLRGAEPLRKAIIAAAPRRSGALARAIVAKIGRRRAGFPNVFTAVDLKLIGAGAEQTRYPYMVEYGVKPHVKRPVKGAWMYRFGYQRVRQIVSAGFAARQYFRGAFNRMRGGIKAGVTAGFQHLLRDALPHGESFEVAGFGD